MRPLGRRGRDTGIDPEARPRPDIDDHGSILRPPNPVATPPGSQNLASTQKPIDDRPKVARLDIEVTFTGDKPTQSEARESEAGAVADLCQRLNGSCQSQCPPDQYGTANEVGHRLPAGDAGDA